MDRSKHYAGIDVVRFMAATIVMVHHLGYKGWTHSRDLIVKIVDHPAASHAPAATYWLGSFGWVGVEIFFVISGLVIANSAASTTPIGFAKSRIYRLYPTAWICATISAAILLALGLIQKLLQKYIGSILLLPMMGFAVYWTLGVEVVFYAVVFFWKLLLPSISLRRLALCLLAWSGLYLLALLGGWHGLPVRVERILLLRHGVFFALGIFLWADTEKRSVFETIWSFLALCLCALEIMLKAKVGFLSPHVITWLFGTGLVFASVSRPLASLPLSPRTAAALRAIGLMTYPLYLMHEEVGGASLHFSLRFGMAPWLAIAISMTVAIAAAYAVVAFCEKPIRNLLRHGIESVEDSFLRGKAGYDALYKTP